MKTNQKIARCSCGDPGDALPAWLAAADQPAGGETGAAIAAIQEVVVTAQRRTENAQDVPIAIQAFSGETLEQLNVTTFDDLIRHLPNVSGASQGPGQVPDLHAGPQRRKRADSIRRLDQRLSERCPLSG